MLPVGEGRSRSCVVGVDGGSDAGPVFGEPFAEEALEAARLTRFVGDFTWETTSAPLGMDKDGIVGGVAIDRDWTALRPLPNFASSLSRGWQ